MRNAAGIAALGVALLPTAWAAPLDFYEWLAIAPVVVTAENLSTYGKYTEFRVEAVHRGDVLLGSLIRVNVRRANRDRNRQIDREALRFEEGTDYLLLLERVAEARADLPATFEFLRGVRGAREVPAEGRTALLQAVERFVQIQERNDDSFTWREFSTMIEETNPVALDTALDQFLKFRRGEAELLGALRPLLLHPAPLTRERVARLIGQILERSGADLHPDAAGLGEDLAARAQRDEVAGVRVAAAEALGRLSGPRIEPILATIARTDPEQEVRYAAERLLLERERKRGAGGGRAGPPTIRDGRGPD